MARHCTLPLALAIYVNFLIGSIRCNDQVNSTNLVTPSLTTVNLNSSGINQFTSSKNVTSKPNDVTIANGGTADSPIFSPSAPPPLPPPPIFLEDLNTTSTVTPNGTTVDIDESTTVESILAVSSSSNHFSTIAPSLHVTALPTTPTITEDVTQQYGSITPTLSPFTNEVVMLTPPFNEEISKVTEKMTAIENHPTTQFFKNVDTPTVIKDKELGTSLNSFFNATRPTGILENKDSENTTTQSLISIPSDNDTMATPNITQLHSSVSYIVESLPKTNITTMDAYNVTSHMINEFYSANKVTVIGNSTQVKESLNFPNTSGVFPITYSHHLNMSENHNPVPPAVLSHNQGETYNSSSEFSKVFMHLERLMLNMMANQNFTINGEDFSNKSVNDGWKALDPHILPYDYNITDRLINSMQFTHNSVPLLDLVHNATNSKRGTDNAEKSSLTVRNVSTSAVDISFPNKYHGFKVIESSGFGMNVATLRNDTTAGTAETGISRRNSVDQYDTSAFTAVPFDAFSLQIDAPVTEIDDDEMTTASWTEEDAINEAAELIVDTYYREMVLHKSGLSTVDLMENNMGDDTTTPVRSDNVSGTLSKEDDPESTNLVDGQFSESDEWSGDDDVYNTLYSEAYGMETSANPQKNLWYC